MRTGSILWILLLVGCGASDRTAAREPKTPVTPYAGWYIEHAGQPLFQPCGESQPLRIVAAADLPARAKAFGLDQDTPVYVRVQGAISGDELRVITVEQFGSPTPVGDCGLTGVVIPPQSR